VAFLAFIIDSQHAMMFGHSLVLHAQEINITLPCKEDIWSASSANEWQRAMLRNSSGELNFEDVKFIDIVKTFMNDPAQSKDMVELDPFGSFIVLHGLISVKWHLQQKAGGSSTGNFQFIYLTMRNRHK
jgi:Fungal specific transcription factor domain